MRFAANPETLSMDILFPEAYKVSARRAALDLAGFALAITVTLVAFARFF